MPHKEEGLQRLGDYLMNSKGAKENEKKKRAGGVSSLAAGSSL